MPISMRFRSDLCDHEDSITLYIFSPHRFLVLYVLFFQNFGWLVFIEFDEMFRIRGLSINQVSRWIPILKVFFVLFYFDKKLVFDL